MSNSPYLVIRWYLRLYSSLSFWFNLFLDSRAEIHPNFNVVCFENLRHHNVISENNWPLKSDVMNLVWQKNVRWLTLEMLRKMKCYFAIPKSTWIKSKVSNFLKLFNKIFYVRFVIEKSSKVPKICTCYLMIPDWKKKNREARDF